MGFRVHNLAESVCWHIHAQTGLDVAVDAARLLDEVHSTRDSAFAGGVETRSFFSDQIILISVQNRLIESHPAILCAGLDNFIEVAVSAFTERDRFLGSQIVPHNLGE